MENKRAKEMFFKYGGSKFFMSRDYLDEEYLSYNIPKETEIMWAKEDCKDLMSENGNYQGNFEGRVHAVCSYCKNFRLYDEAMQVLTFITKHMDDFDSFDKLMICEELVRMNPYLYDEKVRMDIKSFTKDLIKVVRLNPSDFRNQESIKSLFFEDVLTTESVLKRLDELKI